MAKVISINISEKRGIQKKPVSEAELIPDWGIKGDAHAGHWHRQISFLGQESIDKMKKLADGSSEKKVLADLKDGDFAENITTEGIVLYDLPVGTELRIGETLLRVTQIGKQCHQGCAIFQIVHDCIMPREGIFAEVLEGGFIRPGMTIEVLPKTEKDQKLS